MLILASSSPRRQELLRMLTEDFEVITGETKEEVDGRYGPAQMVDVLARRKARAVQVLRPPEDVVIGADTIVVQNGKVLGKPRDEAHAEEMLRALSGRWHTVYTGVAVASGSGCESFLSRTEVEFAPLSSERIAAYIATGEPMDKAGAYGIQGKGAMMVRGIIGDFYTVMGLPVRLLAEFLADHHGIQTNL